MFKKVTNSQKLVSKYNLNNKLYNKVHGSKNDFIHSSSPNTNKYHNALELLSR